LPVPSYPAPPPLLLIISISISILLPLLVSLSVFSKTVAEKFAIDFIAKEKPKFAYCSINPCAVVGPALNEGISFSVAETVLAVLSGQVRFFAGRDGVERKEHI